MQNKSQARVFRPQAMINTLKRLHGQNLENKGLNDLTEAFVSFMTRAKYVSFGLRRTWSHGAVEFLKYRRLLPMLVSDEHELGSAIDSFDLSDSISLSDGSNSTKNVERRITVSNVNPRCTCSQLQSFFGKFGKIKSCVYASEDRRRSMYATLSKSASKTIAVHITFKDEISAERAKNADSFELQFYGQTMVVSTYVPSRRRTTSTHAASSSTSTTTIDDALSTSRCSEAIAVGDCLSRSSSIASVASTSTLCPQTFPLDQLSAKALEAICQHLNAVDRVRLERVSKSWLEATALAWTRCSSLSFNDDDSLRAKFAPPAAPLRNAALLALLRRCSVALRVLDLSATRNLLDDAAVEQIGVLCAALERLDISGVRASPDALRALGESLPRLRALAYREMTTSNERCFYYLLKGVGRTLRHLDLRGCTRLLGHCFKLLGDELHEVLLDGCTNLTDEAIEELCSCCKEIRVLELSGCFALTDSSLSLVTRHLPHLATLTLAGDHFDRISTSTLVALGRVPTLERLELDANVAVDSTVVDAIAGGAARSRLRSLSLAFVGSDSTINSECLESLRQLEALEELDLSGLAAVNATTLTTIVIGCSKLRRLVLRSCIYLNDDGVRAIGRLVALESCDLSGCILVSATAVQHLLDTYTFEKQPTGTTITLCIGGTVCDSHLLRARKTRVSLDLDDYSTLVQDAKFVQTWMAAAGNDYDATSEQSADEDADENFVALSAHRSFADALAADDDDRYDADDRRLADWAEAEAKKLGLLPSSS